MSKIKVHLPDKCEVMDGTKYNSIKDMLLAHGIPLNNPCGGNGSCGKCKVQIKTAFGTEEVLACKTKPMDGCEITVPSSSLLERGIVAADVEITDSECKMQEHRYAVAVDLGTTTVVVALVSMKDGHVVDLRKEWNRQISYGSDVISRVKYIMDHEDGLHVLSSLIQGQVRDMICSMVGSLTSLDSSEASESSNSRDFMDYIEKIHIAGNTIMQHIFSVIDPGPIAVAPYTPQTLFMEDMAYHFELFSGVPTYFLPCISGYVGGDIVSGLYYTGLNNDPSTNLFLDIGTNGEMAISSGGQIKTVSVATGPAFEGAEISCGMTGIPGAINHVDWQETQCKINLDIIGHTTAQGLCGSGLMDLAAVLIETGYIDETGRLLHDKEAKKEVNRLTHARFKACLGYKFLQDDEDGRAQFYLRHNPDVYLTSQDVRKLQLAKASVAAGIEYLLYQENKKYEDINHVYLAGGFGEHINPESAAIIGLIPKELKDEMISLGNTSLKGVVKSLTDENAFPVMREIAKQAMYTELSGNAYFSEEFINQMNFE